MRASDTAQKIWFSLHVVGMESAARSGVEEGGSRGRAVALRLSWTELKGSARGGRRRAEMVKAGRAEEKIKRRGGDGRGKPFDVRAQVGKGKDQKRRGGDVGRRGERRTRNTPRATSFRCFLSCLIAR